MNFQNLMLKLARGAAAAAFAGLVMMPVLGQEASHIGMPIDWSFRHIILTSEYTPEMAAAANRDPRIVYNWLQRQRGRQQKRAISAAAATSGGAQAKSSPKMSIDWSVSLGTGFVAQNISPAKYSFNPNLAADCANDFAIFGLNVSGVTGG